MPDIYRYLLQYLWHFTGTFPFFCLYSPEKILINSLFHLSINLYLINFDLTRFLQKKYVLGSNEFEVYKSLIHAKA